MPRLDELDGGLHVVCHAQSCHDYRQPPSAECADCDLVLDVGELAPSSATRAQHAHVEQLAEEEVFVLATEGVRGLEGGQFVGELLETPRQAVVLGIVVPSLEGIAADDGGIAVVAVGFVRVEVDLSE
jgi:hypothetical protein